MRCFSPYSTLKYTDEELTACDFSKVIMQCMKMRMRFAELVQDEHLWLKSIYI